MKNNLAYICSPYRGNILEKARNILYARHLTKLALQLGYTPITTHLYLTQVLNDNIPMQRRQGLKAGRDILNACDTIIIGARHAAQITQERRAKMLKDRLIDYTESIVKRATYTIKKNEIPHKVHCKSIRARRNDLAGSQRNHAKLFRFNKTLHK